MLSCLSSSTKYDPVDTMEQQRNAFPGTRREGKARPTPDQIEKMNLVQTGGNALMRYDPETMSDLVKVVVPPGCQPGEMVLVTAPDDKNRAVNVIIPRHCSKPGTSFLVQFPPPHTTNNTTIGSKSYDEKNMQMMLIDHDLSLKEGAVRSDPLKEKLLGDEEERNTRDVIDEDSANIHNKDNEERIAFISVPPDAVPGTMMYTQLPGFDKRYLPVRVPKGNVSQFYVAYVFGHTISESEKEERLSRNQQNWHDNPIAYGAPMVTMPFLI